MLTAGQVAQFEVFGFIVLRGLFSPRELSDLSREFDDVLNDDRDGKAFHGEVHQTVMPFVERREPLTQMVADDRIFGTLERLLGPGFWWATRVHGPPSSLSVTVGTASLDGGHLLC